MWTTSVAAFTAAYQPVPVISHARRASAPQMLATNLPIADELMMWARVFRLTDYAALAGGAAVMAGGLAAATSTAGRELLQPRTSDDDGIIFHAAATAATTTAAKSPAPPEHCFLLEEPAAMELDTDKDWWVCDTWSDVPEGKHAENCHAALYEGDYIVACGYPKAATA